MAGHPTMPLEPTRPQGSQWDPWREGNGTTRGLGIKVRFKLQKSSSFWVAMGTCVGLTGGLGLNPFRETCNQPTKAWAAPKQPTHRVAMPKPLWYNPVVGPRVGGVGW